MSSGETGVAVEVQSQPVVKPVAKAASERKHSILDKVLYLLSSVRFGIIMLSVLLICCMIGMLIQQVEVAGFQEYYHRLPPAQRLAYRKLGFFNIYHSWYFNLLLAVTGLNIILASIDRFPTAWRYISKPKLNASPNFMRAQMFNLEAEARETPHEFADKVRSAWKKSGFRARISDDNGRITVFAQKNAVNRLGAYIVHVALLTILTGGFLTSRYGVGGMMEIRPGKTSNTFSTTEMVFEGPKHRQETLPFQVECLDLQQKLIRPEGGLDANNTIDWLSFIKIEDGQTQREALVHLNEPFDYKTDRPPDNVPWLIHKLFGGYRFFQSQFTAFGNARQVSVILKPTDGARTEVTIPRDGMVDVEGIGRVAYLDFYPDYIRTDRGIPNQSGEYKNEVAQLGIILPDGTKQGVLAFNTRLAERSKSSGGEDASGNGNLVQVGGKSFEVILKNFEKVALGHILTVQYDPGRTSVYVGFTLLVLALCCVFFLSHQRVWAVIEPGGRGSKAYFGGNTNRNRPAFESRFNSLVEAVIGGRN